MKLALLFVIFMVASLSGFAFDQEYRNYADVLKTFVHDGSVDYAGLQKNRAGIDRFVSDINSVNQEEYSKWTRNQQLAFWINTYNGWLLQTVINHYPIKKRFLPGLIFPENSVQQIPGIWKGITTKAAGEDVSLDRIEHKILRAQFKEPRIHFAIVCASHGCPLLRNVPYLPATLDEQLDQAARDFLNNPAKVDIDPAKREVALSHIFKWFSEDFVRFAGEDWKKNYSTDKAGPLAFVCKYRAPAECDALKTQSYSVKYLDYDWSLNEMNRQ